MKKALQQKLKKIINDPTKLKAVLTKLPPTEREYIEKYIVDIGGHVEENPLKKFKTKRSDGSPDVKTLEFLSWTKPFQFIIGGNKGGKTAKITYKGDLIALGLHDKFKRKPEPGRPLINWLCGENRDVLEQTPVEELTKWLRPDQWKAIKKGTVVDRIRIWPDPNIVNCYSDFILKPYSGGVDVFESANVNGVIICDEEMPEIIFRAIIPRMVAHGAWMFNALTPTHGITYMRDVLAGSGDYAGLMAEGLIDWMRVSTEENLENIDKASYTALLAANSVYDEDGNPVYNPDGTRKLTPAGEIRLRGDFASISGRVYPTFAREKFGENWHQFDDHEMPDISEMKIFGMTDYGRRDDFVFALTAVDKTDTHWVIDEVYQKNMETHDQAIAIRTLCDRWGVVPIMIVADCQINDKMAKGGTILDDYQNCRYPKGHEREGEIVLGVGFTSWHAKPEDKKAPATARAEIGRMLEENPKTGKPSIRFSRTRASRMIKCIEYLEWKVGGANEQTKNEDDHGEAALRYYAKNRIRYNEWMTEEEYRQIKNANKRYNVGGNYSPHLSGFKNHMII